MLLAGWAVAVVCDWGWVGGCTTVDCQRIWCGPDQLINEVVYCQTQNEGTECCQCKMKYFTYKGSLPCPNPSMVQRERYEAQGAHCENQNNSLYCIY